MINETDPERLRRMLEREQQTAHREIEIITRRLAARRAEIQRALAALTKPGVPK